MNFSSCSDHSWIINDCYIFSPYLQVWVFLFLQTSFFTAQNIGPMVQRWGLSHLQRCSNCILWLQLTVFFWGGQVFKQMLDQYNNIFDSVLWVHLCSKFCQHIDQLSWWHFHRNCTTSTLSFAKFHRKKVIFIQPSPMSRVWFKVNF